MMAPPRISRPRTVVRQATNAVRKRPLGDLPVDTRGAGKRIGVEKSSDPAFAAYLDQAERYKLLDAVEERILGMTLASGTRKLGQIGPWMTPQAFRARERLICSNLMLVVSIAACYTGQSRVPLADIVQAGNIGLITAVDKYVPGRARLGTYAGWWIARECGNYVMSASGSMRVPRDVATNMRRISRATRRIETTGDQVDADRLADATKLTPAQVKRALSARDLQDTRSLDQVFDNRGEVRPDYKGDEGEHTLGDELLDDTPTPEAIAAKHAEEDELHRKLATVIGERERQVLQLIFGLGGVETCTQKQIARQTGISEDAVSKIVKQALAKLRTSYNEDGIPRIEQLRLIFQPAAG